MLWGHFEAWTTFKADAEHLGVTTQLAEIHKRGRYRFNHIRATQSECFLCEGKTILVYFDTQPTLRPKAQPNLLVSRPGSPLPYSCLQMTRRTTAPRLAVNHLRGRGAQERGGVGELEERRSVVPCWASRAALTASFPSQMVC